jgi:hypothetical protein
MNNTSKQRWLWIGGILLAASYFAPSIINSYRQEAYRKALAERQAAAAKAKQASPLPASNTPQHRHRLMRCWESGRSREWESAGPANG